VSGGEIISFFVSSFGVDADRAHREEEREGGREGGRAAYL
jgi:hypothetical protein